METERGDGKKILGKALKVKKAGKEKSDCATAGTGDRRHTVGSKHPCNTVRDHPGRRPRASKGIKHIQH